jgi:hypothetical protein
VDYQPWLVAILPSQAVKMTCGASGGSHDCATIPPKPGEWLGFLGAIYSTFGATHGPPPSAGFDRITATLKNGWLFAGYAWWWWYQKEGSGYVVQPSGFQSWSPSLSTKMSWCALSSSLVAYQVDVYVMGPKGTSPY